LRYDCALMSLKFDLHSHSNASDGSLSPESLVQRARECGVDVLALTDHDITAGLEAASRSARQWDVQLIPGVEISVSWSGITIHILGLGIDPQNPRLQQGLLELRKFRDWRGEEISRRLEKAGIPGALEGARRHASGAIISRTHFAHFLVEQGRAKDIRDVFKRFLVKNKPGYVPGQWTDLNSALEWIHAAGGLAVIAHPARYKLSATKLRSLLAEFRDCGGEGLEVVSSSHSVDECGTMARLAQQFDLLASCGSDFHAPEQRWAELGRIPPLPDQCVPVWSRLPGLQT